MRVRVLFFGRLKEIVGRGEDSAELSEGTRVEDLFARYGNRFPELEQFRPTVVASVNQEFAEWRTMLSSDDEVAFLPPVSGGQSGVSSAKVGDDIYQLVRAPIGTEQIVSHLKTPEDGAVVVFDGIVRNNSGGRATLHLDYEAYEPMALRKMREIGAEIRAKFPIHRIAMIHRLGRLEIGETSILIAISSPHRRAAFDACRIAIDSFKRSVPIWKKEYFQDGSAWAEGETPQAKISSGSAASTS